MKLDVLPFTGKYFNWWTNTLFSCLPANWLAYFKKYNQQVDLIIGHDDDKIFIQDGTGKIIHSTSLKLSGEANIDEEVDFAIQADSHDSVDILMETEDTDKTEIIDQTEQIDQTNVVRHLFKNKSFDQQSHNTDSIYVNSGEDTSILFNRDELTTRLVDLVDDEDTIIINDDQGTLLTVSPNALKEKEETLLYFNDHGKMRPVDRNQNTETDTAVDFLVNEVDETVDPQNNDSAYIYNIAASLAQKYKGRRKCLYLLPDENVFSLKLNYPVEVLENIESVLRFDLEKHIPLNFQEVRYFYALNINKPQDKVEVDIVVIKTSDYIDLQNAFEFDQDNPVICSTPYFYKNYGTKVNFLEVKRSSESGSILNVKNFHLALNVILLCVLFALPYYLYHQQKLSTEVKTDQEIKKVSSIVSTINKLNSEIKLGAKLSSKIKNDLRMIYLLAELSDNIDSTAWITRFTYKNGEVKIKGEAKSATSVSDGLNDTGLFESIKFISSIVKNPQTQKESFELSLRVKSNA